MSRMDPAEKRAAFECLKERLGRGRVKPTKRKAFTKKEREAIFAAYEGHCADCGMSCAKRRWDGDHITPLFRGGKHVMANWQLLCAGPGSCHENKTGLEATPNAKIRRIEDREINGPKPSTLQSRGDWAAGRALTSPSLKRTVSGQVVERSR